MKCRTIVDKISVACGLQRLIKYRAIVAYTSVACGLYFFLNTVPLRPTPLWPVAYTSY